MGLASALSVGCGSSTGQPDTVSRAEFEQIFPGHSGFYNYDGFAAHTHFDSRKDAAQFLANVAHETAGLTRVEEEVGRRAVYCDESMAYGCPAGRNSYFGRGPMQLSWNYNYKAAGDALGLDLLHDPGRVARDPDLAWQTAAWYWDNRVPRGDFGATIRAINGAQECDGRSPDQVQSRVHQYRRITNLLGIDPGDNLSC